MISEEEIRRIAKLSYLEIKDEEIDEMREKFSSILEYVKKLQELDVSLVRETANLSQSENVFRNDIGEERDSEDLLKALPRRRDNYLEVKKILYNEDN
ncbi:MAG: Asp-tRNA(Asn)/Glu-tRNA(Gln) amidotransferase subunit GatC [Minisyncoccales bacterium]